MLTQTVIQVSIDVMCWKPIYGSLALDFVAQTR